MKAQKKLRRLRDSNRETEDRLLEVFDRLLARKSYGTVELDEVAREAYLPSGEIYLHFNNRQDLIVGHFDWVSRRILSAESAIAAQEDLPWLERMRRLLFFRVTAHFDAVQHFEESLVEILRDVGPTLLARRDEAVDREADVLQQLLDEGQKVGCLREQDSRATAVALLVFSNALLPYQTGSPMGGRRLLGENITRLLDVLVNGIGVIDSVAGRRRAPSLLPA